MRIHVRPQNQSEQVLSLKQVNVLLSRGELDGDEPAWTPGLSEWSRLDSLNGVVLPAPPPLMNDKPHEPPPPFTGPIATLPRDTVVPDSSTEPQSPVGAGPKGIGGWLAFFCIGLTILGPLFSFGQMASAWAQASAAFERFPSLKTAVCYENFGSALILLYGFFVGCKVWGGHPAGKQLAKQYLKLRLIGVIGIELITLLLMPSLPTQMFRAALAGLVKAVIGEGAYFLVWWLYFKKSRRVRNTYAPAHIKRKRRPCPLRWKQFYRFLLVYTLFVAAYLCAWGYSLADVEGWPGLVFIPVPILLSSLAFSFCTFAPAGLLLWLPVFVVLKGINKSKVRSPYTFIIVASIVLALLDVTRLLPLFTGRDGWGPWHLLQDASLQDRVVPQGTVGSGF